MSRNNDNHTPATGGVGTATVVQIVFLILKLTKLIDLSWFWVLFPTILGVGLFLLGLAIGGIVALIAYLQDRKELKKRLKAAAEQRAALQKEREERKRAEEEAKRLAPKQYLIQQSDLQDPNFTELNKFFAHISEEFNTKYCYLMESAGRGIAVGPDVTINRRTALLNCYDAQLNHISNFIVSLSDYSSITVYVDEPRMGTVAIDGQDITFVETKIPRPKEWPPNETY